MKKNVCETKRSHNPINFLRILNIPSKKGGKIKNLLKHIPTIIREEFINHLD